MKQTKLMLGDNIESLKKLPDNSVDAVVSDPPYGLSFMNKKWDYDVPSVDFWKEVYRVLKPGGHILSFGGTRTYHRMVVNIEDAGFEIRDQIIWLYGSGFPKSHNIGKAVDKLEGNEREVVGDNPNHRKTSGLLELGFQDGKESSTITKGNSKWEGYGTALKPANEPICLARKPLSEKSVAENVLKWRTGGLNIDGCRIGFRNEADKESAKPGSLNATGENSMFGLKSGNEQNPEGRFPANLILECICDEVIKGEKGEIKEFHRKESGSIYGGGKGLGDTKGNYISGDKGDIHTNPNCPCRLMDNQSGGASRFFYNAKVSKAERNMGLDEFEDRKQAGSMLANTALTMRLGGASLKNEPKEIQPKKNHHPTVKPINLMAYLCRLITPPGGVILDPFMGSGSTGIAALLEGFRFIGMELDPNYFKIAETRIENYELYRKFKK